jgi:hypothetical protein
MHSTPNAIKKKNKNTFIGETVISCRNDQFLPLTASK